MQTFLPYSNYELTAKCLDYRRLGKQRVETLQILNALSIPIGKTGAWSNHPATRMWRNYSAELARYGIVICKEWIARGYRDTCQEKIAQFLSFDLAKPPWLGNTAFHLSHQSNLLRKDNVYYSQFGWNVASNLPYVWPV